MTTNTNKSSEPLQEDKSRFFDLAIQICILETDVHKINDRFLVIHGKPSAHVTIVDLHTEEAATFHDLTVDSIISAISLTNDIRKCVDHISQFTGHFATLSGLKIEE